jgi:XTP/dITP diphosphohydrolase
MNTKNLTIVFGTNNNHKIKEVRSMLPKDIIILSLKDVNCDDDLPETGTTFHANAQQKARYVFEKFGMNCFADDSGLEVLSLNGRPGVYSARYAGNNARSEDNMSKLLFELKGKTDRRAKFKTVICLYLNDEVHFFEGEIAGEITLEPSGESGFGYDPVFIPEGETRTFSEMTETEKNSMSHRRRAIDQLIQFLWNQ